MLEPGASVFSAAVILFFVMDPIGNTPLFLSMLKDIEPRRRRYIIVRELVVALLILFTFLFFGQALLAALALEQESVSIAGGIVLLIIALRMIFPSKEGVLGEGIEGEPFIVPLAVPLIAGPSAMATLILMARSEPNAMGKWTLALVISWAASALVISTGPLLYRVLKERGLVALERLTGMLLVMIAVQMLVNGLHTAFS